jgi:hypothetical protein
MFGDSSAPVSGAATVDFNFAKVKNDIASFTALFKKNFYNEFSARGAQFACRYLNEKIAQTERSRNNLKERFKGAQTANKIFEGQLNQGIYTAFYTKFVAELALNFLTSFGPVPFLANVLINVGYCAACKVAENATDAEDAEIVGVLDVASQGSGTAASYWQKVTGDKVALRESITEGHFQSWQTTLKEGAYSGRNVELLEESMRYQRNYLQSLEKLGGAKVAARSAQAGGFFVGLLFMAPQIKTALTGNLRRMEGKPEVKRK